MRISCSVSVHRDRVDFFLMQNGRFNAMKLSAIARPRCVTQMLHPALRRGVTVKILPVNSYALYFIQCLSKVFLEGQFIVVFGFRWR